MSDAHELLAAGARWGSAARRGPVELWERFDEVVAELDRVGEGRSIRAVGRPNAELAEVAADLAEAVKRQDRASGFLPSAASTRRHAS